VGSFFLAPHLSSPSGEENGGELGEDNRRVGHSLRVAHPAKKIKEGLNLRRRKSDNFGNS
jgi:hypothetical protein